MSVASCREPIVRRWQLNKASAADSLRLKPAARHLLSTSNEEPPRWSFQVQKRASTYRALLQDRDIVSTILPEIEEADVCVVDFAYLVGGYGPPIRIVL